MRQLTYNELKKVWSDFRSSKNHAYLKPSSLVAAKDSTALFTVAWMQQLIPFLMGKVHPLGKRLFNIQRCLRTNDIDEIGDERHLASFEMMGNWSLGDYFKNDALKYSIEFLSDVLLIPKNRIWATIFAGSKKHAIPRDSESEGILKELGIQHITEIGFDENDESDNFWIAGSEWPCGPCCEIHVDRGEGRWPSDWALGVNDRYTEVWNNVFMEFYKNKDWSLSPLPQKNVDTGMGLGRLLMFLQDKETIFDTDLFKPILEALGQYFTVQFWIPREYPSYSVSEIAMTDEQKVITRSYRIIAEHINSSTFLLRDWVVPSNEWRWYVLRRLIRRMFYHMQKIGLDELAWKTTQEELIAFFLPIITQILVTDQDQHTQPNNVAIMLVKECMQFQDTIKKSWKMIDQAFQKAKVNGNMLPGEFIFQAYDTYGIPVELLDELAQAEDLALDMDGYKKAMEQAREKSRDATKNKFSKWIDRSAYISDMPQTQYIGYQMSSWDKNDFEMKLLKDFEVDGQRVLVFDKTPFYAEWWGEVWDRWIIILDNGEEVKIQDVQKSLGVYLHLVA